jgi:ribose transport system substrate-binding protein
MGGKGNMIIVNGPQVSSVIERVNGCKEVISKHSGIKLLSSDQDAKGSRDGGLAVMQSLLTRFTTVDGVFAINDPTAIGAELAAKQMQRTNFPITAVDGAPDAEAALKDANSTQFVASASQDPFMMARLAVQEGLDLLNGKKPAKDPLLMDSKLITRDNVADFKGWTSAR